MKNKTLLTCLATTPFLVSTALFPPEALAQASSPDQRVYGYVEEMPAYKGGDAEFLNFLASNTRYPQDAREAGLQGIVVVSFIVETNGTLSDIKTEKSLSESLDAEAIRLIGLTDGKWITGKQYGKPIRVKSVFPVKFSLGKDGNPVVLHKMPQFKGGQEAMVRAIYEHLKMPAAAQKENVNARLDVKFNVEPDGSVSNISIANTKLKRTVGAGADMDYMDASTFKLQDKTVLAQLTEAAAGAVKGTSGMWEPGLKHAKPVVSEVVLPVLISGPGEADVNQQLETMLLAYQPDAYDRKGTYEENEVDVSAVLKDGPVHKFLKENLRYPDTDFTGRVEVFYIVLLHGGIVGPIVSNQEEEKAIADEIKRVFDLAEGKWIPAKKNKQPVAASKTITVEFVTSKGKNKASTHAATPADVVVTRYR